MEKGPVSSTNRTQFNTYFKTQLEELKTRQIIISDSNAALGHVSQLDYL